MKRTPFKRQRAPLRAKKPIRRSSPAKTAARASGAGQRAREHMLAVKRLPCLICGAPPPSEAHHCISRRYGTRKRSDYATIPLCRPCHRTGPDAIHASKALWEARHGLDIDFLPLVMELLEINNERPLSEGDDDDQP